MRFCPKELGKSIMKEYTVTKGNIHPFILLDNKEVFYNIIEIVGKY